MSSTVKPKVQLVGMDGNAFAIMGRVSKALQKAGQGHLVAQYMKEATSGNYDNLLQVTLRYVDDSDDEEEFELSEDEEEDT